MDPLHSLLKRQLKRHFGEPASIPPEWQEFVNQVNAAYLESDTDRAMMERSLELSSQELLDANSEMQAVFDAIPDLVFRISREGVILDVKAGADGELMIARQDLIGKRIQDTPLKEVAHQFSEAIQRVVAENAPVIIEYPAVLHGQESHYEARLAPLPDGQIVVIIRNITERKQSLRLLGSAVEQTTESILITDAELDQPGPRIIFANPAFTKMTGYPAAEVLGKTPRILQGEKSDPAVSRRLRETLTRGETFLGETVNYRKDGTEFFIEWQVAPIHDSSGKTTHYVGIQHDITERKQAETALAYERDLLRSLLDHSPDNIYFKDLQSRFVLISRSKLQDALVRVPDLRKRRAARGLPPDVPEAELLTGLTDFDTLQDDDARLTYEDEQQIISTGEPSVGKITRQTYQDGTVCWWLSSKMPWRGPEGNTIGTFGVSKDITAMKEAEAKLAHEQARFRFVFENIPVGTALTRHYPDGRFERIINDAHLHISGLTREQDRIPGIYKQITHPEDFAREAEMGRPLNDGRDGQFSLEKRYLRLDGTTVWVLFFFQRHNYNDGSFDELTMVKDITERKLAEAAMEQAHREREETSRQAGMAEVATGILHNVGNVLNSVNIASSCIANSLQKSKVANLGKVVGLLREHEDDLGDFLTVNPQGKLIPGYLAQLVEHLDGEQTAVLKELAHLQKNIEHIKDIIALQQGFSKVSGTRELLSVADLVEDALKMNASALARHDILVRREFQDVPLLLVEKHQVLQILVNLVRNATQACAGTNSLEKQITLRILHGNEGVRIAVSDNGIGIAAENLTRIFAHGFTTKPSGHGFGLHSAALAAKKMGGALIVHSDGLGQGATFTLELPYSTREKTYE